VKRILKYLQILK